MSRRKPMRSTDSARSSRRTRCSRTPSGASSTTGSDTRGCVAVASARRHSTSGICRISSRRSSATISSASQGAPVEAEERTSPRRSRSSSSMRRTEPSEKFRSMLPSPALAATATVLSPERRSARVPRVAAPGGCARSHAACSASSCARRLVRPAAALAGTSSICATNATAPAACSRSGRWKSTSRPASTTVNGFGSAGRAMQGWSVDVRATYTSRFAFVTTSASCAKGTTSTARSTSRSRKRRSAPR